MRALLLKGNSAYDILDGFIDELGSALNARGYETPVLDAKRASTAEIFDTIDGLRSEKPIDFVFSFSILGRTRDGRGRSVADAAGAPHILQFVDYPLTHVQRLDEISREAALLTVDETHVDAITSIYGPQHFAYVGFSPHAAIGELAPPEKDAQEFAAKRPISILFAGTFYRDGEAPWNALQAPVRKVFDDALEIADSAEFMPALEAFDQAMAASGLDPSDTKFQSLRKGARLVHEQIRQRRRFLLLKAAAKFGLPMHVFGSGYERQLYRFKNVTFGGAVPYTEVLRLMRRTRIVLNANANFGAGSHERPLSAMLAGAVAVSDHSSFYEKNFRDGEEICLFKWQELDAGLARVAALAEQPKAAFAIAGAGQKRAAAEHRWSNRAQAIIAAAEAARSRTMAVA